MCFYQVVELSSEHKTENLHIKCLHFHLTFLMQYFIMCIITG